MKLPLNLNLVQFLLKQGYNYWLSRTDISQEYIRPNVTLTPVQKPVCLTLPDGYSYFEILSKTIEIASEMERYGEVTVNLNNDDFLNYKKFLIEEVSPRSI
jgi:hypothetical protein